MHHAPRTLGARYGSLYRPSLQKPQTAVYKSHDTWHCRQQHGPRATAAVPNTSSSNTGSISTAGTSSSGASPIVSSSTGLTTDWEARRKQRVVRDLVEASKRLGPQYTLEAIAAGVTTLEQLLPGLQIDVEAMKASQWAKLCLDVNAAAMRLVVLKTEYPKADLTKIMQKQPQLLLTNIPTLQDNAKQVCSALRLVAILCAYMAAAAFTSQWQIPVCLHGQGTQLAEPSMQQQQVFPLSVDCCTLSHGTLVSCASVQTAKPCTA
eukprot:GHRR01028358.1.p1 GENE.GHRR01028358.1~~GHRR01028358.1.p1  ORF type:complete len:264 (+),score=85.57 GHRR01028358.1:283-1074(+)